MMTYLERNKRYLVALDLTSHPEKNLALLIARFLEGQETTHHEKLVEQRFHLEVDVQVAEEIEYFDICSECGREIDFRHGNYQQIRDGFFAHRVCPRVHASP